LKYHSHTNILKPGKLFIICWILILSTVFSASGLDTANKDVQALVTSTQQQALTYLEQLNTLQPSAHWPHINPKAFLTNLKNNVKNPLSMYAGKGTNFCGYGALSYLFLQDDPLGYATLLVQLYRNGKASFGDSDFDPSEAIQQEAGQLKYKGILDINPAEQMWYLTLADHYKGYLNIFNRKYDPGDENLFWASVNYAKFNRMTRKLLHYKVNARGADLIRPKNLDLYEYISDKMLKGIVVLFINNRIVHKKDHITVKLGVPTHFIVVESISMQNDLITLVYWDYGRKTLMQLSAGFFKRIIFGISSFTKTDADAK
jgi:hypothetical protein